MEPRLGDIVLNRYALVSQIRSEAGLQVWKASDRVLTHDCQLFIIRDTRFLPEINSLSSMLALSRNRRFTQVLQLHHQDNVAILLTALDDGMSLTEYISRAGKPTPLSYEAIRTIVGETASALSKLLLNGMTHHAISTDVVRLTSNGVEIADTSISPMLEDVTNISNSEDKIPAQSIENIATRQLSALLYSLLTRTPSRKCTSYDLSLIPHSAPSEFRMICKRGLAVAGSNKSNNVIPMASIAELSALLGTCTPLKKLTDQDILIARDAAEPSVSLVKLHNAEDDVLLPFPDDLAQDEEKLEAKFTQQENEKANDRLKNMSSLASLSDASVRGAGAGKIGTGFAAAGAGIKNAGRTIGSLLKRNAGADQKNNSNADSETGTTTDFDFHDIAAAEMANILAPTELDADDSIFPTLPSTYTRFPATSRNADNRSQQISVDAQTNSQSNNDVDIDVQSFDFQHLLKENTKHTELMSRPQNLTFEAESTGRVPVVDANGRFVAPGEESARALREEQLEEESQDGASSDAASLPPSFRPQKRKDTTRPHKNNSNNPDDIADAKIFGCFSTKVIAIGVVVLLLIACLLLAINSLFIHENPSSLGVNSPWNTDIQSVPFGSRGVLPKEKTANNHGSHNKNSKQVKPMPEPKMPENNTPYTIDRRQFLTYPAKQPGYGYYMHLTEPQEVYRFVISIRSSGGHAYLLANTKNDPTQGEQVAEFTFDESGTTDVKLSKIVKSQDFMLWIPKGSMPNHSFYINSVKMY